MISWTGVKDRKNRKNLLSVFDAVPEEIGGIQARQGFAFQDDVAAHFYVQMLLDENLNEVSCETYDDIVLIWQSESSKMAEFVQVKAEHPDRLWNIAKLCQRKKSKENPDGTGTSILEKSLARDQYLETAWFRIVTCRQIHSELKVLTTEREHDQRSHSYPQFKGLIQGIEARVKGVKSRNGHDISYWLLNACWDIFQENDIAGLNQANLAHALNKLELPCDPDAVREIYNNLRSLAKQTAEFGLEKWKEKRVSRDQLISRINDWFDPYPHMGRIERLKQKLLDAGLDQICLNVAKDQRGFYLNEKRTAGYLKIELAGQIEQRVLDTLNNLRSSLDSGKITASGVKFHDLCLKEVRALPAHQEGSGAASSPAYLAGCMYEITARCRHRFTKVVL
jgi:hypothetical protein